MTVPLDTCTCLLIKKKVIPINDLEHRFGEKRDKKM